MNETLIEKKTKWKIRKNTMFKKTEAEGRYYKTINNTIDKGKQT